GIRPGAGAGPGPAGDLIAGPRHGGALGAAAGADAGGRATDAAAAAAHGRADAVGARRRGHEADRGALVRLHVVQGALDRAAGRRAVAAPA
ncbi:MAG: hypothetical protein F9K25_18955, partial [Candidatus Contendobacter sp.]